MTNHINTEEHTEYRFLVTRSCLNYMIRRTELTEFTKLYHEMAHFCVTTQNATPGDVKSFYYSYRRKKQFFLGLYVCKLVDLYHQYISEILVEFLTLNPKLISIKEKKKAEEAIYRSEAEKLYYYAERNVQEASFSSTIKLASFIKDKTDLDIFDDVEIRDFAVLLTAIRNLIIHNDSTIDEIFLRRTKGIRAPLSWMAKTGQFLAGG